MEVTKKQAAEMLKVSQKAIVRMIESGELQARKKTESKFSDWLVTVPDGELDDLEVKVEKDIITKMSKPEPEPEPEPEPQDEQEDFEEPLITLQAEPEPQNEAPLITLQAEPEPQNEVPLMTLQAEPEPELKPEPEPDIVDSETELAEAEDKIKKTEEKALKRREYLEEAKRKLERKEEKDELRWWF
ncbi:MAG: helix-turn-helix domain-containing protein [Candidatus Bathyarchaeota archaeon]